MAKNVFIVGAKRTPFGNFGGSLKEWTATDMGAHAAKAALASSGASPESISSIVFGNVAQTSADAAYLARHVGLRAGTPVPATALTVNRLCGSGFQSIINLAQEIVLGEAEIGIAGGAESMSQAPMAVYGHKARFGLKLGSDMKLVDTLWAGLTDSLTKTPMGITAENLAVKYEITSTEANEYAARSQALWGVANEAGVFDAEIEPIMLKTRKGEVEFKTDEGPRPGTTAEMLAKLPTVFKKDGTVNAGNASGITDGAAALIVAGEEEVAKQGLTPLARIVSWGISGVEPEIMGIGPCPAVRMALERASLSLGDMDMVEVNEAFAPQVLAVAKELGIDMDKLNTNGGAIALGHPLGASGARIMAHLSHRLAKGEGKYALGSACIGGGQGIAIILERV